MKTFSAWLIIIFLVLTTSVVQAQNTTREDGYPCSEAIMLYRQNMKKDASLHPLAENYCPQFRGINCLGKAPAGAKPPASPDPNKNLAWKTAIARGVSSPCVWGNSIFLTGYNPYNRLLITYCIDKETGMVLWEQSLLPDSLETVHPVGSPAAATPATDGKHVYVYFGSYGVACYSLEGTLVWERKLPVPKSGYGSCGSPVIAGDTLLVNRLREIMALNKKTGEVLYTTKVTGSQSTPVIWKNQILIHQYKGLKSINIADGSQNWDFNIVSLGNSTPVLSNNVLFVNGFTNVGEARLYNKLPEFETMLLSADQNTDSLIQITEIPDSLALFRRPGLDLPYPEDTMYSWQKAAPNYDSDKDGALNNSEWKKMKGSWEKHMVEHGVVAIKLPENEQEKPQLIWKENHYIAEIPSLLCVNNKVYMITNGGLVTCMNAETGEIIYREKLGAPGAYLASPLFADGHIYFTSYNGKITVIKPGDSLQVISQCNLKEKIVASPIAVGNQLFIRTEKKLYSFRDT